MVRLFHLLQAGTWIFRIYTGLFESVLVRLEKKKTRAIPSQFKPKRSQSGLRIDTSCDLLVQDDLIVALNRDLGVISREKSRFWPNYPLKNFELQLLIGAVPNRIKSNRAQNRFKTYHIALDDLTLVRGDLGSFLPPYWSKFSK